MPDLILVRHAPTAWSGLYYCGRRDPPLDRRGLAAADRLTNVLAPTLPVATRIVSSPRQRARQTAEAIASRARSARLDVDARWAEIDFGRAEGLTFEQLEGLFPEIAAAAVAGEVGIDWPGGETSAAFKRRVEAAWYDVAELSETTVVVTHGGPLRVAIGLATDRTPASIAIPDPGTFLRFDRTLVVQRTSVQTG